jgi:glycosyltransferase involved in cell wall biosynthesis
MVGKAVRARVWTRGITRCLPTSGTRFPTLSLEQFAISEPEAAAALLDEELGEARTFAARLEAKLDALIRSGEESATLTRMASACASIVDTDLRGFFLSCLAGSGRSATSRRMRAGRLRSVWGTTPIINLGPMSRADRLAGNEAETLVYTTYHVTGDFDISLKRQHDWIAANEPNLQLSFFWLVFIWALLRYDVFFYFNDRGILLPTGGYGSSRFGINLQEMQLLRLAGKRLFTLTYGADHRTRNTTLALGKFNFCMDCPEVGKFCVCDDGGGRTMFATIARYAHAMLAAGLSFRYVPGGVNLHFLVVDVEKMEPRYGPPAADRPLKLVHAPNHPHFKGTHYLEQAVARLQSEGHAIELSMLTGVSNEEVLELLRSADLVADQFIGGSFGYFAVEAMALGKPVLCYVRDPSLLPSPEALPIISANPDTLYDVLRAVIADRASLPEIGRRSRAYVETNLSIPAFAERLRGLYLTRGDLPWATYRRLSGNRSSALFAFAAARIGALPRNLSYQAQRGSPLRRNTVFAGQVLRHLWRRRRVPLEFAGRAVGRVASIARRAAWAVLRPALLGARAVVQAIGIPIAIGLGRACTAWRSRFGRPRTLWGVTPILTLPRLAACDRLLGLRSDSLVFTTYHVASNFDINLKRVSDWVIVRHPHLYRPFTWLVLLYAVVRFDVFHVFCDRGILLPPGRMGLNPREMALLRRAGKQLFTYTYGADVRTREATLALGKFNFCMDCPEPGKFCVCDDQAGAQNMRNIERYANAMFAMGDMTAYVPAGRVFHFWPLDTDAIPYVGTDPRAGQPLRVAHAPNHPHFKGTSYLLDAIDRLRNEGVAIELVRVQGVPNTEVMRVLAGADLVVEQLIGGFHGYTALEAMALGKPVVSYLRGPDMAVNATECPIINADPDTIYRVLRDCAADPSRLAELGRRGRAYVEKYYSYPAVAAGLAAGYLDAGFFSRRIAAELRGKAEALRQLAQSKAETVARC